jgi:hypothetical protein
MSRCAWNFMEPGVHKGLGLSLRKEDKGSWSGSSSWVPTLQVWHPEFKSHCHQKKKPRKEDKSSTVAWERALEGTCAGKAVTLSCVLSMVRDVYMTQSGDRRTGQDIEHFHSATQNDMQFITYKLFISSVFHLVFLGCGQQITETSETKSCE